MYKIICTEGNIQFTTRLNKKTVEGQFHETLSDAWNCLQNFRFGVNILQKKPAEYTMKELEDRKIEFTLQLEDGRVYKFVLSKEEGHYE